MHFLMSIAGDARLAKNVKNKVYSIDLVSSDPSVIACDMSKVCRLAKSNSPYIPIKLHPFFSCSIDL